jgi:biopolymer transport protein ExbB/TolQ
MMSDFDPSSQTVKLLRICFLICSVVWLLFQIATYKDLEEENHFLLKEIAHMSHLTSSHTHQLQSQKSEKSIAIREFPRERKEKNKFKKEIEYIIID